MRRSSSSLPSSAAGTTPLIPRAEFRCPPNRGIIHLWPFRDYLLDRDDPKPAHAIAAKAANPDPALRYSNVVELVRDVTRFLDREAVLAYRESIWERTIRWISRNRALIVLIVAYLCARIAIFFLAGR